MRRYRYQITGIVQGVGFRPFVYRLAQEAGLGGYVLNDGNGVTLELEGENEAIELFFHRFYNELPPLARIDSLKKCVIESLGERGFRIIASDAGSSKRTAVSPDMTICDSCIEEMRDPKNRRYLYPFINCTDCGPRYTITVTVPYDRPNTSMERFEMCSRCREEYEDPMNRRYHAQPISCHDCGPTLSLLVGDTRFDVRKRDVVKETARLFKEGKIVAVKGMGGFHLMCDASNDAAVERLRERKQRPFKPFAIMVKDLQTAVELADADSTEKELLSSVIRPVVIMKKSDKTPSQALSDAVAPAIDRIGIMLPSTPLHLLLLDHLETPLVATSANLGGEPIIRGAEELQRKLGDVVDAILDHDREIVNACDDSVVQVVDSRIQWIRMARGIAPLTMPLEKVSGKKILAVGANQKNSIALVHGERIVLSPHIGDLDSIGSMDYFQRTVETFRRFYDFEPDIVVCDKHPRYETTKWTKNLSAMRKTLHIQTVQHHFAHTLAVMAEYGITDSVLSFVWDGTGYSEDGTIWGGEVLLCDVKGFERVASLRPFRLLGGEKAIREPRRSALSLLFECYTKEEVAKLDSPTVAAFKPSEISLLHQMWQRGINSPLTTSMGRLFDAVASLEGICQYVTYEGESGLRMEAAAGGEKPIPLPLSVDKGVIDWRPAVRKIAEERPDMVADRFIASLVGVIVKIAKEYNEVPIVMVGGVFQNRTLYRAAKGALQSMNRTLLHPLNIPPNDGSIALGQAWYTLHTE